ncbi:MAG TPA: MotA/TolQ/ExbB proton channel family protein [Bacteroidales bacterium]|nr:MotA/TolQ/ExbB proton channel family protein [Bacteroidales bacterium]HOR76691.1 MotA/TolQ/ExbB proton channel family protein [Bacteroidales bacterium]
MKKLFAFLTIAAIFSFGIAVSVLAQDDTTSTEITETELQDEAIEEEVAVPTLEAEPEEQKEFHQVIKEQFIEGGWEFMGVILLTLIFGLALAIERIIYLNLSTTNTTKLLKKVESALETGGVEKAKEICKDTRGPVASIFYQGLERYDEGLETVEKSIVSYGSVLMGRLESGLSWISLFIALAPMLGFLGTVVGMIIAFDNIAAAGDISPTIVASGIKIALLTTVFGLIVAIILQLFYNYIVSKIESLVNSMEDSTISFIDIMTKHKSKE